jgi:hypothetical protein
MHGPEWLTAEYTLPVFHELSTMKLSSVTNKTPIEVPQATVKNTSLISNVMKIEKLNHFQRLLRVTAYVLRFACNCRNREKR